MRPALLALVLLALLAPAAAAQDPGDEPDPDAPQDTTAPSIEVVGQATLTARDDTARVPIGMVARRRTPAAALAASARKADRVIAKLRAAGVPAADIDVLNVRLTRFHLNGRITRAVASNRIRLTVHALRRVRALTAAARAAGANRIGEPAFFVSDPKALYERALLLAFDDAQAKADTLAEQSDQTVGEPISIREAPPRDPVAVDERHSRVEATLTVEFALEEF